VVIIRALASPVAVNIIAARRYPERVDGLGVTCCKNTRRTLVSSCRRIGGEPSHRHLGAMQDGEVSPSSSRCRRRAPAPSRHRARGWCAARGASTARRPRRTSRCAKSGPAWTRCAHQQVVDSYLGPLRDLDLALFIVARNESSEMECQEKHGGDQQGCRR